MFFYPTTYPTPKPCNGCGLHYGHVDGCPHDAVPSTERLPEPAKCECGVKFTGGLHSDWCALAEKP